MYPINGIIPQGRAAGYETMLSLRSFGNEQVHSAHFAWESNRRKAVATPKFYLFDTGVANFLRGSNDIREGSSEYGKVFEQFIAMELRAWLSYRRIKKTLRFWRTRSGTEVDFLIGRDTAIEVEAAKTVHDKHLKGLRALKEEEIFSQFILVSFDGMNRKTDDGIRILHWSRFLVLLWKDDLITPDSIIPTPT